MCVWESAKTIATVFQRQPNRLHDLCHSDKAAKHVCHLNIMYIYEYWLRKKLQMEERQNETGEEEKKIEFKKPTARILWHEA